ncbi:MAG: hypothetical protein Q7K57_57835 [Burkholderiaceae bacterium]|nr:hypothetical protein [Burkholderiaceae bacterium]
MSKSGIDQNALVTMFAQATTENGELLRKAVSEAALRARHGHELTGDNIRKVLATVTQAASLGAERNLTALREGRDAGLRATQTLLASYAALASGMLMDMSAGVQRGAASGASRSGEK